MSAGSPWLLASVVNEASIRSSNEPCCPWRSATSRPPNAARQSLRSHPEAERIRLEGFDEVCHRLGGAVLHVGSELSVCLRACPTVDKLACLVGQVTPFIRPERGADPTEDAGAAIE